MLPELLLQILQGDSSDSSQGQNSSNDNGARLNDSDSDEEIHTWFELSDGVDYVQNAVTTVFNNPNLLAVIATFVPDPPRPPSPPPRPENAVRRFPRLGQARGPPLRYREWETSWGHVYSFPLYAPSHPLDYRFDTIDWYVADTDDEEDDADSVEDTEYLEYLDRGGDPRSWTREQREEE